MQTFEYSVVVAGEKVVSVDTGALWRNIVYRIYESKHVAILMETCFFLRLRGLS